MARSNKKAVRVPTIDRERLVAVATPVVRVVAGILVVACLGACSWALYRAAMRSERFRIDPSVVVGEGLPDWIPAHVASAIARDVKALPTLSIFDPELATSLSGEIRGVSPWIRGVTRVERVFPNQARVELDLQRPMIAVEQGARRFLIAADGKVLDAHPSDQTFVFPFLVLDVVGARLERSLRVGEVVVEAPLQLAARAALEMSALRESDRATLLSIEPTALDLDIARSSQEYGKDEIFLRIRDNNVLIRWGRPRDWNLGALENPIARKIAFLRAILAIYPRLHGLRDVRLDSNVPYYRELGFDKAWQFLDPPQVDE